MSSRPSGRPSATKRTSTAPPKPANCSIHPSAVIAHHALLTGTHPITLSDNVVLHPYAKITSAEGPVIVGEGVVVSERAIVGVLTDKEREEKRRSKGVGDQELREMEGGKGEGVTGRAVILEDNVVVESGAIVEAAQVGEGTVIDVEARLGVSSVIGKYCRIGPSIVIEPHTQIPDFTVVYGPNLQRKDTTLEKRMEVQKLKTRGHDMQLMMLKRLIPNNIAKWQ